MSMRRDAHGAASHEARPDPTSQRVADARARLDARVLEFIRSASFTHHDDEHFAALALEVFAFQFEHCAAYRSFCLARDIRPETTRDWRTIPAVPTGAFKEMRLACFAPSHTCKVFRTSGTSTQRRGEVHLDTLALYEASLLRTQQALLFPDLAENERVTIRVLAPSPAEAPDSSLSHMFGCTLQRFGDAASGFDVHDGALDRDALERAVAQACRSDRPLVLCGTSFAFVHWLDALAGHRPGPLPTGSCVMETGGYKGRSREVPREQLRTALCEALGLPESHVVNQYGMCELGSQFYDSTRVDPLGPRRKLGPAWARVRLVDPRSGNAAAAGQPGMIVVHDLSNTGSIAAIQTADLGQVVAAPGPFGDGFDVLGRDRDAEERGCSVASDAMLGDDGP